MAWNIRTSRQIEADLEVLRHQVNVDVAASITLDASTVAPDPITGERVLKSGTLLTKNSNNQYQRYTGATPDQDVQTLTFANATGGTFTMTHGGNTTAATAYDPDDTDATAALIATRLEALASLDDVEVSGSGIAADPFVITIVAPEDADTAITADGTNLTGAGATVTVGRATPAIRGVLTSTIKFPDGTSKSDAPAAMWCHGQWFRTDRIVDWATHGTAAKAALPTCRFD